MTTARLEAFSDAVIAIVITIMVLELGIPHTADLDALRPLLVSPVLYVTGISVAYVNRWVALGFYVFVALIWLVPDRRIEAILDEESVSARG